MQSLFDFIITPKDNRRYNNTKNIEDIEIITSTSQEDHRFSNREGIVVNVPKGYSGEIKIGDTLLVHHNVFKFYYDMKGRQRSGRSFLKDNTFFVDEDQFFLYKQNGKWKPHSKYCFVKPIDTEESIIYKNTKHEPLIGIMKYANKELNDLGVENGDRVCFKPDTEYEFIVDDEKLYRIMSQSITGVWKKN
tara:strand:+ start:2600 stop:3172 length:573 start_codon:yes stop_codon:yes gene_type:complete